MEDLKEVFRGEAGEILQKLETDIVSLEDKDTPDPKVINRIFRQVHTLKGSSGIAGLTDVSEFTHVLESLLADARSGKLQITEDFIDILLESLDCVKLMTFGAKQGVDIEKIKEPLLQRLDAYKESSAPEEEPAQEKAPIQASENQPSKQEKDSLVSAIERLEQLILQKTEGTTISSKTYRIIANFREDIYEFGLDPLRIIEELAEAGTILKNKVNKKALPPFKDLDPEKCYIGWDILIRTTEPLEKIEDIFLFVADDNDITIQDVTVKKRPDKTASGSVDKRIGEILINNNIISEKELENILEIQTYKNKRFAELIVEKGYATHEDVQHALNEQEKLKHQIETTTVRVATSKLDSLLNLLGEIVIGQSAITKVAEELRDEDALKVRNAVHGLDRITREFQEQIMKIRMIPIGPSFEQFRRFVRDTAKEHGKEINLLMEGMETELDKTVIERIGDPLKHMIRNSIDHGIETPEERKSLAKSRKGLVTLKAYHQEGNVYIEIIDDGRGIDIEKVRKKAESIGIIKSGEELSEEKILSFLFLPGFSTAEKVGALSGRGVGMDVVKTNVEALRGSINIITKNGEGSTIRIKLPLTLAIIDGMLVKIGNSVYVIPLLSIIESIQPERESIKTVEGKGEALYLRDEYVSFVRLYEFFDIEPDHKDPSKALVVIVESNGVALGLMVDELIGQQQIVIKSIDTKITRTRAISGASILGNGQVSLIIDVHGLVAEIAG